MPNLNAFESAYRRLSGQRAQYKIDALDLTTDEVIRDYFAERREDLAEAITQTHGVFISHILQEASAANDTALVRDAAIGVTVVRDAAIGVTVMKALREYVAAALLNRVLTAPDAWGERERMAS